MSEQFIGEIRLAGFNFAPPDWLPCDGSTPNIKDYEQLFALIGTTYGGDGQSTFGLPDLRGRVPIHQGTGSGQTVAMGQAIGSESVTLTSPQVGAHNHVVATGSTATTDTPGSAVILGDVSGPAGTAPPPAYGAASALTAMNAKSITPTGGSQSHENRQPLITVNYIIAAFGIYPSAN